MSQNYNDTISVLNDSIEVLNDSLNNIEPLGDAALLSKIGELKLKIGALKGRLNNINFLIKGVQSTNDTIEKISEN